MAFDLLIRHEGTYSQGAGNNFASSRTFRDSYQFNDCIGGIMTAICKFTMAQSIQVENNSSSTTELNKRILRQIDRRILLIMFLTYNLNFIDKTILSSAAVFGLEDDLALVGT